MGELARLRKELRARNPEINKALRGYKKVWENGNLAVFSELVFCLCTPQSNAKKCDEAVRLMKRRGCFDSRGGIRRCLLTRVRFHNNKTNHILGATELFMENGKIKIKPMLVELGIEKNPMEVRNWLDKNVKGLGLKEASHFLRNIGRGERIAILDRHILKNLAILGVIEEVPKTMTRKRYLEIEEAMKSFARRVKIPMSHLDLVSGAKRRGKCSSRA